MASGYPTPDNETGDVVYNCIPIVVPDNPEFQRVFAAAIYGLYANMSKPYFWREFGTMSPERAAELSSYALALTDAFAECGATMTCEQVADCIETSSDVAIQLAINNSKNNIAVAGRNTTVNPETTTVEDSGGIGTAGLAEQVKPIENCNQDKLWAGIRDGIVQRLDDNARNFLEVLVARADLAERAQELINLVPVIGTMLVAVIEQVTELAPDMLNLYNSYSSIENLDNIACGLFDMVCADCQYPTYQQLFSHYASAGITGIDDIGNLVLTAATDYLTGSTELAALAFYHTMISYQLFILYLKTKFGSAYGTQSILVWAGLGEDYANDNWQVLCDGCDEDYEIWTWDFSTQGQGEFYQDTVTASHAIFIAGQGWRAGNYGAGKRGDICMVFDPTWKIRAVGMEIVGSTPSSTIYYRRPTWGSNTGVVSPSAGSTCGGYTKAWDGYAGVTGYNEVLFFWQGAATDIMTLKRVSIIFDKGFAPENTIARVSAGLCS